MTRVSPVATPEPGGIVPGLVAIHVPDTPEPGGLITVPSAIVPSWHDRHNLEYPVGALGFGGLTSYASKLVLHT